MTRKHYQAIAEMVATVISHAGVGTEAQMYSLAWKAAHSLSGTNPRFDAQRFVIAVADKWRTF